jgi:hypothetical protein
MLFFFASKRNKTLLQPKNRSNLWYFFKRTCCHYGIRRSWCKPICIKIVTKSKTSYVWNYWFWMYL